MFKWTVNLRNYFNFVQFQFIFICPCTKKKNGELGVTVQNNEKKIVQEDTDPVCLVCAVSERKRYESASSWLILSNILISSAVPYYPILRYIYIAAP